MIPVTTGFAIAREGGCLRRGPSAADIISLKRLWRGALTILPRLLFIHSSDGRHLFYSGPEVSQCFSAAGDQSKRAHRTPSWRRQDPAIPPMGPGLATNPLCRGCAHPRRPRYTCVLYETYINCFWMHSHPTVIPFNSESTIGTTGSCTAAIR
jgi:hypothetical protein